MTDTSMKSEYSIAHFSDFHLCDTNEDFVFSLKMIDDAIVRGAEHIIITGDIVECGQMDVYASFFQELKSRSLANPARLTIIPGNHDIFPFSKRAVPSLRRPTANFDELLRIIQPSMCGRNVLSLLSDEPFPYAKTLRTDVLLVALDTTRNGQFNPRHWAEGELSSGHRIAAKKFLSRQQNVRHRIIVMHHSPWHETFHGGCVCEQNFVEPSPGKVLRWIEGIGVTLLLCGHVHAKSGIRRERIGKNCIGLRAGASGGVDDDGPRGKRRIYHSIHLMEDGSTKIDPITFWDGIQPQADLEAYIERTADNVEVVKNTANKLILNTRRMLGKILS